LRASGIIFCGGKSSRMGTPKALLPFGDEVMLARVVRLLSQVVHPIVVVAAAEQPLPVLPPSVIIVRDERPERGPLEGLRAGLKALEGVADVAYVSSCDVPLLVPAFVERMLAELVDVQIAVPMETNGEQTQYHPLAAVYRTSVLPAVEGLLAADQLRMTGLFEVVRTQRVPVKRLQDVDPELLTLRNVNCQEDYSAVLAYQQRDLGKRGSPRS
jgi:molybdopterin-guanine dinucleotide biosynthesis protein A